SVTTRHFAEMVDAFLANPANANAKSNIEAMLNRWRAAALALPPLEEKSFLMEELGPVSQSLGAASDAGLQALLHFGENTPAAQERRAQQLAVLDAASQTRAQVTLAIVPAIRKLVEASAEKRQQCRRQNRSQAFNSSASGKRSCDLASAAANNSSTCTSSHSFAMATSLTRR